MAHSFKQTLIQTERTLKIIGAHDALSARIGQEASFDAIWASGLGISATHCVPDANILTMSECLVPVASMVQAVQIPVIADCDSGYGDLPNIARLVKDYERTGVAAICIEDKVFPKLNSFIANNGLQLLISINDFKSKLSVACESRTSTDFVIVARTEALIVGRTMSEAIDRALAYEAAGADAIVVHSKQRDPAEIETFCSIYKGRCPLIVVPTTYPMLTTELAYKMGISGVIFANHGIRSCVSAMRRTFETISREGNSLSVESTLAPLSEIFALQNTERLESLYARHCAIDSTPGGSGTEHQSIQPP